VKRIMLLAIFSIGLNSCVTPPNMVGCRNLAPKKESKFIKDLGRTVTIDRMNPVCKKEINEAECGFCTYSIDTRIKYVGEKKANWLYGKPWSQIKREAGLIPAEDLARLKAYIINTCKNTGQCDKAVSNWRTKLDSLDSVPDLIR